MGGGGKIPYPHHVWSPTGGWYSRPANWRANTAVMAGVIGGVVLLAFNLSASREHRERMPEQGRFFPSRNWSREIVAHDKAVKEGRA